MIVTACLPQGTPLGPGRPVEVWAPSSEPGAPEAVVEAAQHWSRYLLGYADLQLAEGGVIGEAVRGGEPVVLLRTVLVDA